MSIYPQIKKWRAALDKVQAQEASGTTDHHAWSDGDVAECLADEIATYAAAKEELPDHLKAIEHEIRIRPRLIEEEEEEVEEEPEPATAKKVKAMPMSGGFARVPNALVDQLWPVIEWTDAKGLIYCHRIADRTGAFRVGGGTLAKRIGSKYRTTGQRVLARLTASGLIEKTRGGAAGFVCHYRLVAISKVDIEKAKRVLQTRPPHRRKVDAHGHPGGRPRASRV